MAAAGGAGAVEGRVFNCASLSGKGSQGMGNMPGKQDNLGPLSEGSSSLSRALRPWLGRR